VHPAACPGVDVVYGREGDASGGRGCAVARVAEGGTDGDAGGGRFVYVVVTYRFPSVSALAVERLLEFAAGPLREAVGGGAVME
jgi:hypothetical protein